MSFITPMMAYICDLWWLTHYVWCLQQWGCDDIESGWDGRFNAFLVRLGSHTHSMGDNIFIVYDVINRVFPWFKKNGVLSASVDVMSYSVPMVWYMQWVWSHTYIGCDVINRVFFLFLFQTVKICLFFGQNTV